MLFAVAHAVHLTDGAYAIRCPEFPGCEARNTSVEIARQEFGEALREHLLKRIEVGEALPLYGYADLEAHFASRCTLQIQAPDRMPGSFDRVLAVRAKLPPDAVRRVEIGSAAPLSHPNAGKPAPAVVSTGDPAAQNTSIIESPSPGKLDPSARLALVAAHLARRDRHAG